MPKNAFIPAALTSALAVLIASSPPVAAQTNAVKQAEPSSLDWTEQGRSALEEALQNRAAHGLDAVTFLKAAPDGEQPAARNARYTAAALSYAGALAHGIADPASLHDVYTIARPNPDLRAGLQGALAEGRLASWLAALAPQDDEYRRMSEAYRSFRSAAQNQQPATAIPAKGAIHVGDSDPRVEAIAQQLADGDYLPASQGSGSGAPTYTQAMADAVTALQKDYGIVADGIVGPDTLGVLNMNRGDRARALAVALERRRWLSRNPPATRIDVNTAAARLRYFRDGKLVDERRVIVGQPGRETPMLGSPIYRLVANPTWTIPKSIEEGEMANVSSSYLQAHNMVRRNGWIVQQPGPDNALGLVKFDMRNEHAIYLHDTSSPALFERSQRHLSHGCVRVDDALGFADMLAEQEGVSNEWQEARASGEQTFVPLPQSIPVRLIYANVFVNGNGRIVFRTDPYGWDGPVAKVLGFADGSAKQAAAPNIDIGP